MRTIQPLNRRWYISREDEPETWAEIIDKVNEIIDVINNFIDQYNAHENTKDRIHTK